MVTIKPSKLVKGDLIGIISPAGPAYGEKKTILSQGLKYLENCGYKIKSGNHYLNEYGYLAGSDNQRLHDLHNMFSDKKVKAVFCTRGGYGSGRLLDKIDYDLIKNNPKIIVGYSDITALQLAIFAQTGLVSLSGPMPAIELGKPMNSLTEASLWNALHGHPVHDINLDDPPIKIIKPGRCKGRLIGGCLSIFVNLLGTPFIPNMNNAVLLLEEIGENWYKIDRNLTHLKNAGILKKINGLILGDFVNCSSGNGNSLDFEQILNDLLEQYDIPIVANVPYGHGISKFTMPIGCQIEIDTSTKKIHFLEAAVKQ